MPETTTLLSSLPADVRIPAVQAALNATDPAVTQVQASSPDMSLVTYAPMIGKFVVIFAGGYLLKKGIDVSAWTGEQWVTVIGGILTAGGAAITWFSNLTRARREHQIALASASASAAATQAAGRPVEVAVQPPASKV